MKPSEVLRAAKAKIATPGTWIQKVAARNVAGDCVFSGSPEAVCWCSLGAILATGADQMFSAMQVLDLSLGVNTGWWNDAPERTHEEVMVAFDRAIVLAESEGQ